MIFKKKKLSFPVIIDKVFSDEDFYNLKQHINSNSDKFAYDPDFKRYVYNSKYLMDNFSIKLEKIAKKIFKDKTLESSYCLYAKYKGHETKLEKHKDSNANTYLIDLCIFEKTQWPIFIEGKKYTLKENQGIAFLPMEWEHWRESFPDPDNNVVEIIMFYFCSKNDLNWQNIKSLMQSNYIDVRNIKNDQ